MKTIIKIGLITCFASALCSCEKMQDNYSKYVQPGGIAYPQSPKNPVIHSGYGRVVIEWDKGNDPSITKALVTWDNGEGSKEFDIRGNDEDVSIEIDGLDERNYSFVVKTVNANGQTSVPTELNSIVYGDYYKSSIYNRTLEFAYTDVDLKLNLTWSATDLNTGILYTDLTYQSTNGANKNMRIEASADGKTIVIDDYKKGTEISYQSAFQPDETCIDTFSSVEDKNTPVEFLDRSNWEIKANSYEPTGQEAYGGGKPEYLLDGKTITASATGLPVATYWHSNVGGSPGFPYWLAVDTKKDTDIQAVMLQRRSDSEGGNSFSFRDFTVMVGNDNTCWTDPAGSNQWVELGDYSIYDLTGTTAQYYRVSAEGKYRYFKVILKNGFTQHCHLAELGLLGVYPK